MGMSFQPAVFTRGYPQKTAYLKRDTFEKRPIIFGVEFHSCIFRWMVSVFFQHAHPNSNYTQLKRYQHAHPQKLRQLG